MGWPKNWRLPGTFPAGPGRMPPATVVEAGLANSDVGSLAMAVAHKKRGWSSKGRTPRAELTTPSRLSDLLLPAGLAASSVPVDISLENGPFSPGSSSDKD